MTSSHKHSTTGKPAFLRGGTPDSKARPGTPLTPREVDVLATYARIGDYHETAAILGLAYHTVKQHLWSAYGRLQVRSGIEAFNKLGWIRPEYMRTPGSDVGDRESGDPTGHGPMTAGDGVAVTRRPQKKVA